MSLNIDVQQGSIQETLLLKEVTKLKLRVLTETRGDLQELIEKYMNANRMYHFEGSRGVSNFDKLIGVLGYRDLDEFLSDNSGCLNAMVEWIGQQNVDEWVKNFEAEVPNGEEE